MSVEQAYPYPNSFAAAAALYAQRGLEVTPPEGNNHWGKHMVCAAHDGVPYCLNTNDCQGQLDPSKVDGAIKRRQQTIERHHDHVKAVYDYCLAQGFGPVWAMCGGGSQLQVFFGHKEGYIAILYLTLKHEPYEATDEEDSAAHVLQVQSGKYDEKFSAMTVPGVQARTWNEVYGLR